ncbi:MAG: alkaline phosphatase family protein [Propionibacteriaceae bacterium]|nr:alkaline phosphatase family protein [Propionibacteriaceae bacterium]
MSHNPHDDRSVADLLTGVGAHLGAGGEDPLGLPDARRFVVVLVDGLGWDLVWRALPAAPYLAGVIGDARRVTTGLPTTTAASLMSLWTGVAPGQHGVVGYSFALDGTAPRLTTPLSLSEPLATADSVMDGLVGRGIAVSWVGPAEHLGTGLTRMGTRRATFTGVNVTDEPARVAAVVRASQTGTNSLVYVYEPRLDHAGHRHGVASDEWLAALRDIDAFLEALRDGLGADVCLLVTGDHGMVDVLPNERLVIDDTPELNRDLRLAGGEARFRHLYTPRPAAVAARWRERLGATADIWTRCEAIEAGLFGPVAPGYADRIGDVVVVPRGGGAYLTKGFPGEFHLVGMHGAATPAERYVPVVVD